MAIPVWGWLVAGALALVALAGCDEKRIQKLEEGLSTEADVRREFGEPATVYDQADGSRILDYPRQPEGQRNYMITIGPDGRMSALRQVLTPANFAKIQPGMGPDEVQRMLGRPAKKQTFSLKRETVWDWRYAEGQKAREFSVTFDADMRVVATDMHDDPKVTHGPL